MKPLTIDHRQGADTNVDIPFLLKRPAGKDGFISIRAGHFVKPNGERSNHVAESTRCH
jgi:hypothetical protein